MGIYLDNGYLDIERIRNTKCPFVFVVGGRATGKTYGMLENVVEHGEKFLFLRRTQTQLEQIIKPEYSPFKSLNNDHEWDIVPASISKHTAGFYIAENVDNELKPSGVPIGYAAALSTISNLRGFDASDVSVIIYDEFIAEAHERPLKNESAALFNAYETVNRNRELQGKPPVQMVCLANANDLGNPIFLELGLVKIAQKMRDKGTELWTDPKRGICLCILQDSPISQRKSDTALYRLTAGSEFQSMSLDNAFADEHIGKIKPMPLKEYRPVVNVGEITVYRHKANREYYISEHCTGSPPRFGSGDVDLSRFCKLYYWIWGEYVRGNIVFESKVCEILLTRYFN